MQMQLDRAKEQAQEYRARLENSEKQRYILEEESDIKIQTMQQKIDL